MDFSNSPLETVISPANSTQPGEVKPQYWFRRVDGNVFCTDENEAWNILKGRVRIMNYGPVKYTYLGKSSGQVYFKGLAEMKKVFKEQGLEKAQEFLRDLEKREMESADPSIRPRNFDTTHLTTGLPTSLEKIKEMGV